MNVLDIIIILIVIAAAVRGVSVGLLRQIGSFGGFLLGLMVGAVVAPWLADLLPATNNHGLVVFGLYIGIALIVAGAGEVLGERGAGLAQRWHLETADGVLGAVFGFGASMAAIWLLASALGPSAGPTLSAQISNSRILRTLDATLPPAPEVTAKLERAIGASAFPRVFVGIEPAPAPPVTGPNAAAINAAVAAASDATVKIEGYGCGGVLDGSGFVAADGLVVTNAHVVAGIARPVVIDKAGVHRATVVGFNPDLDMAVLRTSGLAAKPLPIANADQPRGTVGAVLGYPGGGSLTAGGAAILGQQTAVGRSIYGAGLVRRDIYELQAVVRPGNSGGPLVAPDGTVIGLIFATSTTNPNVGYALTSTEILPGLAAARTAGALSTGACAAD